MELEDFKGAIEMIPDNHQKLSFLEKLRGKIPEEWTELLRQYIQENFTNHFAPEDDSVKPT